MLASFNYQLAVAQSNLRVKYLETEEVPRSDWPMHACRELSLLFMGVGGTETGGPGKCKKTRKV